MGISAELWRSAHERSLASLAQRCGLALFLAGYALWFVPAAIDSHYEAGRDAGCRLVSSAYDDEFDCRQLPGGTSEGVPIVLMGGIIGAVAVYYLLAVARLPR